jgi:hypothetical protein
MRGRFRYLSDFLGEFQMSAFTRIPHATPSFETSLRMFLENLQGKGDKHEVSMCL